MDTSGPDIIRGIAIAGPAIRPGDRALRLAGPTSAFGHDRKPSCLPLLRPADIDGVRAVIVAGELRELA